MRDEFDDEHKRGDDEDHHQSRDYGDWDGVDRRRSDRRSVDITSASLSLEKVAVIIVTVISVLGSLMTAWMSLNQRISDLASEVKTNHIQGHSLDEDLSEKLADIKVRIDKLEAAHESDTKNALEQNKATDAELSDLRDTVRNLYTQIKRGKQ